MEAASKRGCSGDRLSALSDDLLGHILSLLPSRQAVQTSVLSRRWTDLWRTVPAINLRTTDFRGPVDDIKETWRKMGDFTANLLMRHRAPQLDAFRLHISCYFGLSRHIDRWIRRGFEYRPSVLEIQLSWMSRLPHLRASRLKVLHLFSVFLDHAFEDQLRSGCPVLEDLVISNCYNEFGTIQSNSLKKLTVDCCSSTVADMLVIKAPYLASLRLIFDFNSYKSGALLDTGNSLVEASISVVPSQFAPVNEAVLLGCVFNVTSLELGGFSTMAMLDKELDKFPIFNNLTTLSLNRCLLDDCDVHKFNAIGRFLLQRCPNMKNLTLMHFEVMPFVAPVQFPRLENLRTLVLDYCDLSDNLQLLRRCLRCSPDLEKLTVWFCGLPEVCSGGKGRTKSKKYSRFQFHSLARFQCQKLKSTEIIYRKGTKIQELVSFCLDVTNHAPENIIKLTKM